MERLDEPALGLMFPIPPGGSDDGTPVRRRTGCMPWTRRSPLSVGEPGPTR